MRALGLALVLAGCSGHEYVDNLMHADIVTAQIAAGGARGEPMSARVEAVLVNGSVGRETPNPTMLVRRAGCTGSCRELAFNFTLTASFDRHFEPYESRSVVLVSDPAFGPFADPSAGSAVGPVAGSMPIRCGQPLTARMTFGRAPDESDDLVVGDGPGQTMTTIPCRGDGGT
jgi:hypothetical protein